MASVILVVGLGYGDEGKGSFVDYLCRTRPVHTVVRYCGGAQAAHNVITPDGRHHLFAQFGSGTFVPGVRTHLSRHMLVNPLFLMSEEQGLREVGVTDGFERMTIERSALVTNPFQVAANRLREMARSKGRHGSCGMGIGETVADFVANPDMAIRVGDLEHPDVLRAKLRYSQERKMAEVVGLVSAMAMNDDIDREYRLVTDPAVIDLCVERYVEFTKLVKLVDADWLRAALDEPGCVVFEGAQGVLLDQDYGTFPYVTRSKTTLENAYDLLGDFDGEVTRLGLLRTYMTRHGAGPFVTEDESLDYPEIHNCYGPWQESWRQGHLDLVAIDYAIRAVGGVDEVGVTHLDCISGPQRVCTGYDMEWPLPVATEEKARLRELQGVTEALLGASPSYTVAETAADLLSMVEGVAGAPATIVSYGRTAEDKYERRSRTGPRESLRPGRQAEAHHREAPCPGRSVHPPPLHI